MDLFAGKVIAGFESFGIILINLHEFFVCFKFEVAL